MPKKPNLKKTDSRINIHTGKPVLSNQEYARKHGLKPSFISKPPDEYTLDDWEKLNASVSGVSTAASLNPVFTTIAAPVRLISGIIGAGIDTYQAQDAFRKGNYKSGVYDVVTGGLSAFGGAGAKYLSSTNADEIAGIMGAGLDFADVSDLKKLVINDEDNQEPKKIVANSVKKSSTMPQQFAYGGTVMKKIPINIEDNELLEYPNGQVAQADGATHEQGGINTSVPAGTKVYSDRIKVGDHTMAERKADRTKKYMKLIEEASESTSTLVKNRVKRSMAFLSKLEQHDLTIQNLAEESMNIMQEDQRQQFALGSDGVRGVRSGRTQGYNPLEVFAPITEQTYQSYESLDEGSYDPRGFYTYPKLKDNWKSPYYRFNRELNSWSRLDNNLAETPISDQPTIDLLNNSYSPAPKAFDPVLDIKDTDIELPTEAITPDVIDSTSISNPGKYTGGSTGLFGGMKMTSGDMVGLGASVIGNVAQAINTINNAKATKKSFNEFEGFNTNALQANAEALDEVGYMTDVARRAMERKLGIASNSARARARGSATSINSLRNLDLATDVASNEAMINANNNLEASATGQKMQLLGNRMQLLSEKDKMEMTGQAQADLENEQKMDAFFTNFGQNIAGMTQSMQGVGRQMNQNKYNSMFMNILPQLNRYGVGMDENGNLYQR